MSTPEDWQAFGLCKDSFEPDLWFPSCGESAEPAKQVCNACPVKAECLDYALTHHEVGVWGGTTERERVRLRRRVQREARKRRVA